MAERRGRRNRRHAFPPSIPRASFQAIPTLLLRSEKIAHGGAPDASMPATADGSVSRGGRASCRMRWGALPIAVFKISWQRDDLGRLRPHAQAPPAGCDPALLSDSDPFLPSHCQSLAGMKRGVPQAQALYVVVASGTPISCPRYSRVIEGIRPSSFNSPLHAHVTLPTPCPSGPHPAPISPSRRLSFLFACIWPSPHTCMQNASSCDGKLQGIRNCPMTLHLRPECEVGPCERVPAPEAQPATP
jgi:hypothetical protein